MSASNLLQYAIFLAVVTALVKPVGGYMARVFSWERTLLDPFLCPIEWLIYRATRVAPQEEMDWKEYVTAFVLFGLVGALLLYVLLRIQRFLPWLFSAYQTTPITPDLAMNTAVSFATTTTWQAYAGETTMSYTMRGLATHLRVVEQDCARRRRAGEMPAYLAALGARGMLRARLEWLREAARLHGKKNGLLYFSARALRDFAPEGSKR